MNKTKTKAYIAFLVLSSIFALAAAATLLPWPSARWANILGYKSLCPFAPISTMLCAILALITCTIRAHLFGPHRGEKRSWAVPIAVGIALILVIGISIPSYTSAKIDARSGASVLPR
jgi:hypothetical protein